MATRCRFLAYINGGVVKITIRAGERLSWFRSERTEEGWASRAITWIFDGEVLSREYSSSEQDCDGRVYSDGEDICPVEGLRAYGEGFPDWREVETSQRDFSAEAAGY